jgi:hypothetical protein
MAVHPASWPPYDVKELIVGQLEQLEGASVATPTEVNAQITDAVTQTNPDLMENLSSIAGRIDQSLDRIGEWMEAGENLAIVETPALIQEIVWWGIAVPGFWVALGLICMAVLPLTLWNLRRDPELMEFAPGREIIGAINEQGSTGSLFKAEAGAVVLPIVGFTMVASNIMSMLKPIVAPRLFLVEYLRELAK